MFFDDKVEGRKMLRMIWYRSKVLNILENEFEYKPAVPGWQSKQFNAVTRHLKKQGGNEYDGAVGFILVQINSLREDHEFDKENRIDNEVYEWKEKMNNKVSQLLPRTNLAHKLGLFD